MLFILFYFLALYAAAFLQICRKFCINNAAPKTFMKKADDFLFQRYQITIMPGASLETCARLVPLTLPVIPSVALDFRQTISRDIYLCTTYDDSPENKQYVIMQRYVYKTT